MGPNRIRMKKSKAKDFAKKKDADSAGAPAPTSTNRRARHIPRLAATMRDATSGRMPQALDLVLAMERNSRNTCVTHTKESKP